MRIVFLTTDNREHHRRYEVRVPYFGPAPEALLEGFARLPEVQVEVISCTQQPMASPERLAENIRFHSLLVPKAGWLRTGYQGCIRAIRRKVRELSPDIVHGQGTERDSAIAAAFSGFPNVITIHGNMRRIARITKARPFSFLWCAALLEGFTVPRTDGVVCITTYTEQAVRKLARQTWVVPNAVHPDFFSIARNPGDPPRLICPATICSYKNQNTFIRALDPLAARLTFEVVFLGGVVDGDPYSAEFQSLIRGRPWCRHGGHVDRSALQAALASASAMVLPSLEDNCPMAVLEAMAAGVPVVAAKVGGVPDLIEDGVTGRLCDPRDLQNMAVAVERVLTERAQTGEMAGKAREKALRTYHPQTVAQRHVEIYREVLAGAAGRA